MGQKTNPIGIRLNISRYWNSVWYADHQNYANYLNADLKIREFLTRKLASALVSKIHIERPSRSLHITIHTARPGIVIGKKGEDIERLRKQVSKMVGVNINNVKLGVAEIRNPETNAQLVAESVAQQLVRRVMFRRAMKRVVTGTMRLGVDGIKISLAGRLNGAEIARREWYHEGRVPLHTLRAAIDYGVARAQTTYGTIGVKVWICNGEASVGDKLKESDAGVVSS